MQLPLGHEKIETTGCWMSTCLPDADRAPRGKPFFASGGATLMLGLIAKT
jgi:hypothetical protein